MVEKVNSASQNAYVQQRFKQLNNVQKGDAYVVKGGESLWNIAKSDLGNGAKNSEINDYVMQIAKLNGLDTVEKMNNIKANTTIYKPKKEAPVTPQTSHNKDKVQPDKNKGRKNISIPKIEPKAYVLQNDGTRVARPQFLTISKNNRTLVMPKPETEKKPSLVPKHVPQQPKAALKPVKTEVKPKVTPKPAVAKNAPEEDFSNVINTVLTDKTVKLVDSQLHFIDSDESLYHVVNTYENKSYKSSSHPVLSFTINGKGVISGITFEGRDNTNPYGYDYEIKHNGKNQAQIFKTKYLTTVDEKVGNVPQEDMQKLYEKLQNLVEISNRK